MVRQPNESESAQAESNFTEATGDGSAGSRRQFIQLGAFAALGFASGCGTTPPGDDTGGGAGGAGGSTTTGGAGGTGGSAGMTGTGGSAGGAGGTGGAGGGGTTGGAGGTGGAGTGGTGTGGAGTGGTGGSTTGGTAGTTGGTGAGGMNTTGGSAGKGAGGATGGTAGQGTGGAMGGSPATGGAPPMGGTGGTSTVGKIPGWKEDNSKDAGCKVGTPPAFSAAVSNAKLPDPFKFLSGTRITAKDDWECLRADLSAAAQACMYGPKMPPPDKLTATFSGGKVTVNMTVGSNTANFTFSITGGGSMASPVPCLITCGGSSLPKLSGVAQIDMSNNSFASEQGLGGIVKNLYGNTAAKSGALIGWAWGCSRIIDALELVPEAGINIKRLAVTGCSRNGKGALAMGAFDERVALTIPQEGGSGGPALWRVSEKEKSMGQNIQESSEIVGEADWLGSDFKQYANGQNAKLCADQHFTIALCAPRAVLVIDNDIDWLGPVACFGGGHTAAKVYQGLGIADRCGVTVAANHSHCQFPSAQQKYLDAFVNRFLKGMTADTSGVDDFHVSSTTSKLQKFDEATWIDWTVPTLTGALPWDPFA